MNKVHIGSIIKQKFNESSMTVTEFARKINCERSSVYHIFKQKSIGIERLIKISNTLNYNFIYEVYKDEINKINHSVPATFIAIEMNPDYLQQLNLPDNFIKLIKK